MADESQDSIPPRAETVDQQIRRLRELPVDESIEPALIFRPRED